MIMEHLTRVSLAVLLTTLPPSIQQACDSTDPTPTPSGDVIVTADGTRLVAEVVVSGVVVPWSLAFTPDGRLFFTERPGRVRIVQAGRLLAEPALALDDVYAVEEAGLLGLALDPDFAENRYVYLLYTRRPPNGPPANRIVRYRELANTLAEAVVLFDGIPGFEAHDGGRLKFGPDGTLYATTGDAGRPDDAQDPVSWSGKILRLNPNGTTPADNPLVLPYISSGHRNPQGLDWHPASGALWATEHGAIGNDELNAIVPGANYGWPLIEGDATGPGLRAPVLFFTPSIAPAGAAFYRDSRIPSFRHDFFFATLRDQALHRVQFDADDPSQVVGHERLLAGRFGRLRAVVAGPDGALYLSTSNRDGRGAPTGDDDRIIRLRAAE